MLELQQHLSYQPSFPPDYRPGIGVIGCGNIVRSAHLPAYMKHHLNIADIATFPQQRIPIMRQALAAGKHILAQKPLALDMDQANAIVAEAERSGLKVAVNQNGRWAPPWRIATLLIDDGAIGDVTSITHPTESKAGRGMWAEIQCRDGVTAILRCVGDSHSQQNGHYF